MVQGRRHAMRVILAILFLCTAFSVAQAQSEPSAETLARGKALVIAGDCAGCHTADPAKTVRGGKADRDPPFGAIYSPNLTPDRGTGLDAWSDDDFIRAFRYGVAPDGSRYYPAFPLSVFYQNSPARICWRSAPILQRLPLFATRGPPPQLHWPAELSRGDAGLELFFLSARNIRAKPAEKHGMESGRISGQGGGAIAARATRPRTSSAPPSGAAPLAADRPTAGSRRASTAPASAGGA